MSVGVGAVALLGLGAALGLSASAPRASKLTLDDSQPSGLVLVVEGEELDSLRSLWAARWIAELGAAGVELELDALPAIEGDGSLRLPVRVTPGFAAETLPTPTLFASEETLPVHYRLKLTVAYVDYTDARETAGAQRLFEELLDYLPSNERVSFVAEPRFEFRVVVASRPDAANADAGQPWVAKLRDADLITSGAYLYIRAEQAALRDPSWRAQLSEEEDGPLSVIACSVRASDEYTYASAIVTPAGGALDRELSRRRALPGGRVVGFHDAEELLAALDALPPGQQLQWFVPSKSSTSGYLMPCLDWRALMEDPRVVITPNSGEHRNNLAAAERAAAAGREQGRPAWVLASIYESLLFGEEVEREAWRVLWVEGGIPHGGIYVSNAMLPIERELLIAAMHALIDDYHERGEPFPDFGWGISGLRRCPPDFDGFEEQILASDNVDYCAPELAR